MTVPKKKKKNSKYENGDVNAFRLKLRPNLEVGSKKDL